MRHILLGLLCLPLLFAACAKDTCEQTRTYLNLTPVFVSKSDFRALPIQSEEPRALQLPGKIYTIGDLLLIGERNTGIHFIDNSDKTNPQGVVFLPLGGNTDFVIRDGILYANQYTDLVALDISDPYAIRLLGRTEDAQRPLEWRSDDEIATYYDAEEVTETIDCETWQGIERRGFGCINCQWLGSPEFVDFASNVAAGSVDIVNQLPGTGTGGSMARFTVFKDRLYTVDKSSLRTFAFNGPTVEQTGQTDLWWGIETIIPYRDHLFIGSQTGMFIFEATDPDNPTQVGVFQHARACDPVYVKDDLAYVTLRDGTPCTGTSNQLDLIDISDPSAPTLVETFAMQHPHGLGILDETLYLCEGSFGLKAFDISDPEKLDKNRRWVERDHHSYDLIPLGGTSPSLLVVGDDGFLQLDISNPDRTTLLSRIPVGR